eukprot:gene13770-19678_t
MPPYLLRLFWPDSVQVPDETSATGVCIGSTQHLRPDHASKDVVEVFVHSIEFDGGRGEASKGYIGRWDCHRAPKPGGQPHSKLRKQQMCEEHADRHWDVLLVGLAQVSSASGCLHHAPASAHMTQWPHLECRVQVFLYRHRIWSVPAWDAGNTQGTTPRPASVDSRVLTTPGSVTASVWGLGQSLQPGYGEEETEDAHSGSGGLQKLDEGASAVGTALPVLHEAPSGEEVVLARSCQVLKKKMCVPRRPSRNHQALASPAGFEFLADFIQLVLGVVVAYQLIIFRKHLVGVWSKQLGRWIVQDALVSNISWLASAHPGGLKLHAELCYVLGWIISYMVKLSAWLAALTWGTQGMPALFLLVACSAVFGICLPLALLMDFHNLLSLPLTLTYLALASLYRAHWHYLQVTWALMRGTYQKVAIPGGSSTAKWQVASWWGFSFLSTAHMQGELPGNQICTQAGKQKGEPPGNEICTQAGKQKEEPPGEQKYAQAGKQKGTPPGKQKSTQVPLAHSPVNGVIMGRKEGEGSQAETHTSSPRLELQGKAGVAQRKGGVKEQQGSRAGKPSVAETHGGGDKQGSQKGGQPGLPGTSLDRGGGELQDEEVAIEKTIVGVLLGVPLFALFLTTVVWYLSATLLHVLSVMVQGCLELLTMLVDCSILVLTAWRFISPSSFPSGNFTLQHAETKVRGLHDVVSKPQVVYYRITRLPASYTDILWSFCSTSGAFRGRSSAYEIAMQVAQGKPIMLPWAKQPEA